MPQNCWPRAALQGWITRLSYKLSNGQQSQCVGDGFRLSNPKPTTSLDGTIGRKHHRLWVDFHPNLALKKGGPKPNCCQDHHSPIQSIRRKHQSTQATCSQHGNTNYQAISVCQKRLQIKIDPGTSKPRSTKLKATNESGDADYKMLLGTSLRQARSPQPRHRARR